MTSSRKVYLIDTSFLLAYQDKDNKQLMEHCRTIIKLLKEEEYPKFVLTDMIFTEYSSYIWVKVGRKNRKLAIERIVEVLENFEIEFIDSDIFKLAHELFLRKNAKGYNWPFVDCSSFVFMQERRRKRYGANRLNIRYALAMDEHFDAAQKKFGFEVFQI